ncbi:hypothetical protein [Flavobacterium sp. TSSA_36]|jgi:hypothetical protein|uniref:hypothetical protein n=1 Tax=Flavobacterium sp. TSSA_36 TaxID=3447669 RepID=UPI003F3FE927
MKKQILIIALLFCSSISIAQKEWFSTFSDSTALVKQANLISDTFIKDITKISPKTILVLKTRLNTTPYLIYYDGEGKEKTANLPLWSQVIPQQKAFFYEVSGGEVAGKEVFGLFFNGFYLPHELGHALQHEVEGNVLGSYESEYLANCIAMLWWKKQGKQKELEKCYRYAKKMWAKLPNPIPEGTSIQSYFSENYQQASQNPYIYGYMQFLQFITIYEDASLPKFDTYIKRYLAATPKKK